MGSTRSSRSALALGNVLAAILLGGAASCGTSASTENSANSDQGEAVLGFPTENEASEQGTAPLQVSTELGVGTIFDVERVKDWTLAAETASNQGGLSARKMMFVRSDGERHDVVELILLQVSPMTMSLPEGAPSDAETPPQPSLDSRTGLADGQVVRFDGRELLYRANEEDGSIFVVDHFSDTLEVVVLGTGSRIGIEDVLSLYSSVEIDVSVADCAKSVEAAGCQPDTSIRYWIEPSSLPWIPS